MATHEQHYLTCDGCGVGYQYAGGMAKGETPDCIRSEADDDGWSCYHGNSDDIDYCPSCKKSAVSN